MWREINAIHAIKGAISSIEEGWEDTSIITSSSGDIVLTSDRIGLRAAYPGEDLRSLVRRGVTEAMSDVAASGCSVIGIQIDVQAPDNFNYEDFHAIGLGVQDMLNYSGGILLQGSNISRGEFGLTTTVVGGADKNNKPLRRKSAKVNDLVALSGPVGAWDGALSLLNNNAVIDEWDVVIDSFLNYRPELQFGQALRESGFTHGCIDCNDCLGKSLFDLSSASGTCIIADIDLIPIAYSAEKTLNILSIPTINTAINGISGDDRLLFTFDPENMDLLKKEIFTRTGRTFSVIGRVISGSGAFIKTGDSQIQLPLEQPLVIYNRTNAWKKVKNAIYEAFGTILLPLE